MKPFILDCSILFPGPRVGQVLAEQGYRVVKLENPSRRDPLYRNDRHHYDALNRGKELMLLDFANAERKRFDELVAKADGLIEGYLPETKKKMGLTADRLLSINPRLSILSIVGYPEGHPDRGRAGHELNFAAKSGLLSLTNQMLPLPLGESVLGYRGALTLLSAIAAGKGGVHEVSVFETLLDLQESVRVQFQHDGVTPSYGQTLYTGMHPSYFIYSCADGRRLAVAALEEKYWSAFCSVIGRLDLESARLSKGAEARTAQAQIQSVLAARPWSHWQPLFQRANCCVEPVLDVTEVANG